MNRKAMMFYLMRYKSRTALRAIRKFPSRYMLKMERLVMKTVSKKGIFK